MEKSYVKKTMFINQTNIKKALKILNVKTEKEAVNRTLEIVVEENAIIAIHNELGGAGELEKVYK